MRGRIVITHVGTSALTKPEAVPSTLRSPAAELAKRVEKQQARWTTTELPQEARVMAGAIREFAQLTLQSRQPEERKQEQLSAELASLRALKLVSGDEIVLVASDTELGRVCAILVQDLLLNVSAVAEAPIAGDEQGPIYLHPIERVTGLEVVSARAASTFLSIGLRNYASLAVQLYRRAREKGKELVFNVTAGYKGLIPFTALVAAVLDSEEAGVPCSLCYLYEMGAQVIRLPAVPVLFDREVFDDYSSIFDAAERDGARQERLDFVRMDERARDRYLVKAPEGQLWRLSPVGEVVWTLHTGLARLEEDQ